MFENLPKFLSEWLLSFFLSEKETVSEEKLTQLDIDFTSFEISDF